MRYFDKTFFKFLIGLLLILTFGLLFVSKAQAVLVNINTATKQELDESLPGVGPAVAQSIIDNRPYATIQEISRADGIGEPGSASYENIINLITVGETEEPEQNSAQAETEARVAVESGSSSALEFKTLKLSTQGDMVGVVGQPMEFSAETNSEKLTVTWVFGDGSMAYGHRVEHIYEYPGDYIAVAKVSNSGKRLSARMNVRIVADALAITHASSERVEISNNGKTEINFHGRELRSGDKSFVFPEDTILKPGQKISFPSSITGLSQNNSRFAIAVAGTQDGRDHHKALALSEEDRQKIAAIEREILALQIKQMALRKSESEASPAPAQTASASLASQDFGADTASSSASADSGWLRIIKKFFGFK